MQVNKKPILFTMLNKVKKKNFEKKVEIEMENPRIRAAGNAPD